MAYIVELDRKNRLNKIFLLVFHGGLVCYLFLHNFIIPVVRNLGQGNHFLQDVHYWFIPQFLLLVAFYTRPFNLSSNKFVLDMLLINLAMFILGVFNILLSIKGKITVEHFSSGISLISIACFFLGYFSHFYKYYSWKEYDWKKNGLIAIMFGSFLFYLQNVIIVHPHSKKPHFSSEVQQNINKSENEVMVKLPREPFLNDTKIAIGDDNYDGKTSFFGSNHYATLVNSTSKKHIIRFEKLHSDKWDFVRVLILNNRESVDIELESKQVYRLRSPTSKEIGVHYIVSNSNEFSNIVYRFDKNKVEINP